MSLWMQKHLFTHVVMTIQCNETMRRGWADGRKHGGRGGGVRVWGLSAEEQESGNKSVKSNEEQSSVPTAGTHCRQWHKHHARSFSQTMQNTIQLGPQHTIQLGPWRTPRQWHWTALGKQLNQTLTPCLEDGFHNILSCFTWYSEPV